MGEEELQSLPAVGLTGEVEGCVVQGKAGQHVILPAHEDGECEDKVRDEGEEPGRIEILLFHISSSVSVSTLLALIHWPAASYTLFLPVLFIGSMFVF